MMILGALSFLSTKAAFGDFVKLVINHVVSDTCDLLLFSCGSSPVKEKLEKLVGFFRYELRE